METHNEPSETKSRGGRRGVSRLFRFNLRFLLIAIFLLCAWLAWHMHRTQKQRTAVNAIREFGGWVHYDFEFVNGIPALASNRSFIPAAESDYPDWIVNWLGLDFFHNVVEVNLISDLNRQRTFEPIGTVDHSSSDWANHLDGMPYLRKLSIKGAQIDDAALARIGRLKSLQELWLMGTNAINYNSPEGASDATISAKGIRHLCSAKNLRNVFILWCELDDESLQHIATLPKLQFVRIQGNTFTDAGICHLRHAKLLEQLTISHGGNITDASVEYLGELNKLRTLMLQSTITSSGFDELRKQLPSCNITPLQVRQSERISK